MKTERIIIEVLQELERAETIHPNYPTNEFKALAIWQEEIGEVTKALLDSADKGANRAEVINESIQAIACGVRFLKNLREAEFATDKPIHSEMVQNIIDNELNENNGKSTKLAIAALIIAVLGFISAIADGKNTGAFIVSTWIIVCGVEIVTQLEKLNDKKDA